MIDVDATRTFSALDLIGVQHTIGDETGIRVNATMRRSLSPWLRDAIAEDVIEVF